MKFLPVPKESGFRMDGYYVWCGSIIKGEDSRYYMFASRWKEETRFPDGYMTNSEIVLATSDAPDKPFTFEKVIITKRDGGYWDSMMAHNPFIMKIGDEYVLYYIGTPDGKAETRKIGYAHSKSLTDGWIRSDRPITLPPNANNPCVTLTPDNKLLLYFRDGRLKVSVAAADRYDGEYTVLNNNLFTKGPIEDMFVYPAEDGYIMIAEDAHGVYTGLRKGGVRFESKDGIHWDNETAALAYDFEIDYIDGTHQTLQRRERPMILFDGARNFLVTGAKIDGETILCGGKTWTMVQEIESF
jgi:hypothetical protein